MPATTRRSFLRTTAAGSLLAATAGAAPRPRQDDDPAPKATEKLDLLILGGTGHLGPATVRAALARGHSMTLFNRGKTNPHLFPELEKLRGDRHDDLVALEDRHWDAVIDTSAYVPSHVHATASMLGEQGARQYVLLSTVGVYADHGIPYADEESPAIELTDEVVATMTTIRESLANYGGMKRRCETVAEEAMPGQVTVIRPGLLIGPEDRSDRFTYWTVSTARGGEVLAPGDGSDPIQFVDVRDLGAWIIRCIEERIVGTFNGICPAGRFTMMEMLHGLKGAFTTDARFTWVPVDFLQSQGVQPWTHMPGWVPAVGETAGFQLVRTEKAVAAGLVFRALADTAQDVFAWFEETHEPTYEFGALGYGIPRARQAEVLAAWHEHVAARDEPAPEDD